MTIELLSQAVRKSHASASGRALRTVVCEQCQTRYCYFLHRSAMGQGSYLILTGDSGARMRAAAEAEQRLQKFLARETELVPCPQCHWINRELVRGARLRKRRWLAICALLLIAVGGIASFVVYAISEDQSRTRSDEPLHNAMAVAACFLAAVVLLFPLRALIRRRTDPNRHFPEPPLLVPGTPPALVPDGTRLSVAKVEYALSGNFDGWAVLRWDQMTFPRSCCLCLRETTATYAPRLWVNDKDVPIPVPLCDECRRLFRPVWWLTAVLTLAGASAIGACVLFIPGVDEVTRWTIGSIIAIFGTAIGLFAIPNAVCRPYRVRVIDADRGVSKFASKNEAFTRLLIERARKLDEVYASEATPPADGDAFVAC